MMPALRVSSPGACHRPQVLGPLGPLMAVTVALGCRDAPPASLAATDEAARHGFELAPGQTATVRGHSAITFVGVDRDARCPRGRECAESGPVTVRLRLGAAAEVRLAILDRDQGGPEFQGIHSCTQLDGEALRLRDVTPWPSGDEPPAPEDYRIELIVVATCDAGARK